MENQKLTETDYSNIEVAFQALRKELFANESALIEVINLKARVVANLKDYDSFLDERAKPKIGDVESV